MYFSVKKVKKVKKVNAYKFYQSQNLTVNKTKTKTINTNAYVNIKRIANAEMLFLKNLKQLNQQTNKQQTNKQTNLLLYLIGHNVLKSKKSKKSQKTIKLTKKSTITTF